jgi:large subunit ribosomal protein L3
MKGQKMAGRWGNETITVQNLKIVKVDKDKDLILVKGAVPGPVGNLLIIRKAVKDIK